MAGAFNRNPSFYVFMCVCVLTRGSKPKTVTTPSKNNNKITHKLLRVFCIYTALDGHEAHIALLRSDN